MPAEDVGPVRIGYANATRVLLLLYAGALRCCWGDLWKPCRRNDTLAIRRLLRAEGCSQKGCRALPAPPPPPPRHAQRRGRRLASRAIQMPAWVKESVRENFSRFTAHGKLTLGRLTPMKRRKIACERDDDLDALTRMLRPALPANIAPGCSPCPECCAASRTRVHVKRGLIRDLERKLEIVILGDHDDKGSRTVEGGRVLLLVQTRGAAKGDLQTRGEEVR